MVCIELRMVSLDAPSLLPALSLSYDVMYECTFDTMKFESDKNKNFRRKSYFQFQTDLFFILFKK